MNEIAVSVIIPVYNSVRYIKECLNSLLSQSFLEFEVICIDDKSEDGSLNILKEYSRKDERIKVISFKCNKGAAIARNRGLLESRGKYILFLDADDYLDAETLEELSLRADSDALDICYFKTKLSWELPGLCCDSIPKGIEGYYPQIYAGIELFGIFVDNREFFYYPWLGLYRREFIRKNKLSFRKLLIGEGGLFSLQAILMAQRVGVQDRQYHTYRLHEDSVSKREYDSYPVILGNFIQYVQMLKRLCMETDEQVIDVLKRYLDYQTMQIRSSISGSAHIARTIYDQLNVEYEKYIFKCVFIQNESYFEDFTVEELKKLKSFKNVIVYGAGHAAPDVLRVLDKYGLSILAIAVTNKERNPVSLFGHKVYEIRALVQYCKNSIILVSVNKKYHNSIIEILRKFGFQYYIMLNIKI